MSQLTIEQASQLARQHHQAGQFSQAEALYRQILRLRPDDAQAYGNLGNALQAQGQLDAAIAAYRQAIALNPRQPAVYNNLGVALRNQGKLAEAIAVFGQAIAFDESQHEIHCNLGVALQAQGRVDAAIIAYRRALALNPNYAQAYCNLGVALRIKGDLDAAIAAYERAIALNPNLAAAYSNLGNDLKDRGQLDAALAAYRQALALNPHYPEAHGNLLLALNYSTSTAEHLLQEARAWARQHAEPLHPFIQPHANDRTPERRLRIGYLSADFREHASAFFLVPLLGAHDKTRVEVFCYAHVAREDHRTQRLRALSDHWQNIMGLADEAVAEMIRRDRIDILIDLKLHTENNRLLVLARKPAPVQATWLGYPGTTGLRTIDYRLSDPYLDPPGSDESVYAERTIRLPETFWCYDPLDAREIPCSALPAQAQGLVTFGCLNNFCKVNDAVLRVWAKLLRVIPLARLLMLAPAGTARVRVLTLMGQEGIDPKRLEFVPAQPRRDYLHTYHRIDLSLDSFPYGGHTTSMDSCWMGVPVVTLVGPTVVGRAGLSILSNLGLAELAARTEDEYVEIAGALTCDLPRLSHLRSRLRARMEQSPLMDAPRFARNMEAAFRHMWRQWCTK